MTNVIPAWRWADYLAARKRQEQEMLLFHLVKTLNVARPDLKTLSRDSRVSLRTIERWLNGDTKTATVRTLNAVGRQLGLELAWRPTK